MAPTKKQTNETEMATEPSPAAKAAPVSSPASHATKRHGRGLLFWFLFLAFLAVSTWAYSLSTENRDLRDPEAQARRIVTEMGAHIILPEDEVPGVFPIDKSQAKEPFFKNAQDGDLLVVYRSTQQAFIYSPSRDILVNAGVLVVNPEQEQVSPAKAEKEAAPATATEEEI